MNLNSEKIILLEKIALSSKTIAIIPIMCQTLNNETLNLIWLRLLFNSDY